MARRLDDADHEYRKALGQRIRQAAGLAELTLTELAELSGSDSASLHQMAKGTRHTPPALLSRISEVTGVSVEDLLAEPGAPMTLTEPAGQCGAQYVIQGSGKGCRALVLVTCDRRVHQDEFHRDPRGFRWAAE